MWDNNRRTHVLRSVREAALQRDGHQCTAALQAGGRCPWTSELECHETEQWTPDRRLTVDDVVTLCHFHHNLITQQQAARARKANPPPRDTRPPVKHPGLR